MVGVGEAGDLVGDGREFHAVSGVAGLDRQSRGEVGFPSSRWSEEDQVLLRGDEVQGSQVSDLVAFESRWRGRRRIPRVISVRAVSRLSRVAPRRGLRGR